MKTPTETSGPEKHWSVAGSVGWLAGALLSGTVSTSKVPSGSIKGTLTYLKSSVPFINLHGERSGSHPQMGEPSPCPQVAQAQGLCKHAQSLTALFPSLVFELTVSQRTARAEQAAFSCGKGGEGRELVTIGHLLCARDKGI